MSATRLTPPMAYGTLEITVPAGQLAEGVQVSLDFDPVAAFATAKAVNPNYAKCSAYRTKANTITVYQILDSAMASDVTRSVSWLALG